jgi:hypothetical protein
VNALIDTGTDISAVDPGILGALGLTPFDRVTTHTVGGQVSVGRYKISLSIFGPARAAGPVLLRTEWTVMELPTLLPNINALFGMDLLSECRLIVDGPARQFTMEF